MKTKDLPTVDIKVIKIFIEEMQNYLKITDYKEVQKGLKEMAPDRDIDLINVYAGLSDVLKNFEDQEYVLTEKDALMLVRIFETVSDRMLQTALLIRMKKHG
jgi:hypothetical protein